MCWGPRDFIKQTRSKSYEEKKKYRQGRAGLKCVEKTHLLNGLPDLYFRQLVSEGESNVWTLLKYRSMQPKFKGTGNKAQ